MSERKGDAEPYGVTRLPPLPTDRATDATLETMLIECNGFVYAGAAMNGVLNAVRWLRAHPEARAVLFGDPAGSEASEGRTRPRKRTPRARRFPGDVMSGPHDDPQL